MGGTPFPIVVVSSTFLAVFVATVIVLALEAGTSNAVLAAILVVATAVTAIGLWGVSMAVKETISQLPPFTKSLNSEHSESRTAPAGWNP